MIESDDGRRCTCALVDDDRGGITPTTGKVCEDLLGDSEGVWDGAVASLGEPEVVDAAKRANECALSVAALAAPACRLTISSIVGICCRGLSKAREQASAMSAVVPTVGIIVGLGLVVKALPTGSNDKVGPFEATSVPEFEVGFSKR